MRSRLQAILSIKRQFFQKITNLMNVAQNYTCFRSKLLHGKWFYVLLANVNMYKFCITAFAEMHMFNINTHCYHYILIDAAELNYRCRF